MNKPHALHVSHSPAASRYQTPHYETPQLEQDSAAIRVMLDFCHHEPMVVDSHAPVETVQQIFKVSHENDILIQDSQHKLVGIISRSDVFNGKVLSVINQIRRPFREIEINEVMVPMSKMGRISLREACQASIADILRMMEEYGERHLLVERQHGDDNIICGLFSADQLSWLLNRDVTRGWRALSFAELEQRLVPVELH